MNRLFSFNLIIFLSVLISLITFEVKPQTVLEATGNAYVKGTTAADSNYYFDNLLRVRGATSNLRKSYLKFDLHSITGPISKAELKITINRVVAIAGGINNRSDIFAVDLDTWDEQTLTWNNAPARNAYILTQEFLSKTSTQPDTDYVIDITSYVQSQFAGDKIVSLCMVDTANVGSDIRFWSNRNLLATGPQLIVSSGTVPTITLTSPNGGEAWAVGSSQSITWNSSNITNVKIEYSSNNGTAWNLVTASTPASTKNYAWTVPNTTSTSCKVRVSDASNPAVLSASQSVFTIYDPSAAITVISPNGGETWTIGTVKDITWSSSGVTNVKIEYTTNNGGVWVTVNSSLPASPALYSWTVPYPPSTQCRVRVSDKSFPNVVDTSNTSFSIVDIPNSMFPASANTYVKGGTAADSNFVADSILRVRGATDLSTQRKSYLKFDLTGYNGNLAKAMLQLNVNRVVAITGGLINRSDVFTVSDDSWDQAAMTWNNAPARANYLLTQEFVTKTSTQPDTIYRIDVTQYVRSELAGNKIVSFCLVDTLNNGTDVRFWATRPLVSAGPSLVLYNVTDVERPISVQPDEFQLLQNYPNPFNPATTIGFNIPKAGIVTVKIYDILGNLVRVLSNETRSAGYHEVTWNGNLGNNILASSGIYLCSIEYAGTRKNIKMILNK